jgi:hypothetical protein
LGVYAKLLDDEGLTFSAPVEGMTEDEIDDLEMVCGVTLPIAYTDFLKDCGKKAGTLWGRDWFTYPTLKMLKGFYLKSLARAGYSEGLPDGVFVFLCSDLSVYSYFLCGESDDPEVMLFSEEEGGALASGIAFSDYVKKSILDHGEWIRKYHLNDNPDPR